jgi:transcriptional regulator GlxA family with amidase domain
VDWPQLVAGTAERPADRRTVAQMLSALRTVVILAYDGVQLLDVTGPIEVFEAARERGAPYEVLVASNDGSDILTGSRTRLGADHGFAELPSRIDTLIVPGAPDWRAVVANEELIGAVADLAHRSRRTASVCAGAFVLAAAGLLDGRRAATHWELAQDLACAYPDIDVDNGVSGVADG